MTLFLTSEDVGELADEGLALEAVREGFRCEAAGKTALPVRIDADSPTGFFRVMPAVMDDVMGCKVMTLVRGLGTRYLILLYDVEDGACRAFVDADLVTKIRTAATTALGGLHTVAEPPRSLGVVGTGFEARGHLEFLARTWPLEEVWVYSRSEANRSAFAQEMGESLDLTIHAVASSDEAVGAADTILLATKSPEPVLDGAALRPGAVVLSIGSTRPDLRELDLTTQQRTATMVVDAVEQVLTDSGDLRAAQENGLVTADVVPLANLVAEDRVIERPGSGSRDITLFKSAGTALQDLALVRALYRRALELGRGHDVGEVSQLKPFT